MEQLTHGQLAKVLEAASKIRSAVHAIREQLIFSDEKMALIAIKIEELERILNKLSTTLSLPPSIGGMMRSAVADMLADMLAFIELEPLVKRLDIKGYEPADWGLPSNEERSEVVRRKALSIEEAVDTIILLLERVSFPVQRFDMVQVTARLIRDIRTPRSIWLEVKGPISGGVSYRVLVEDVGVFTAPEVPTWGYPPALRIVIRELLTNGLKFSENPGVRGFQMMRGRLPLGVQIRKEEGRIIVGVTDFGDGVADGLLPHIWKGGFRGKTAIRGRGWGLPMIEELVRLHGGEVGLLIENPGTTFWFSVPDQI